MDTTNITLAELQLIIGNMKRNKALGPDAVTAEQVKHLDYTNQHTLLSIETNGGQKEQLTRNWS